MELPKGYRADLHAHTKVSDDSRTTVRQLLAAAKKAGLHAIAITDHDSVASHKEALRLAPKYGIQVIPGVEITADSGTHILAYFVDSLPEDRSLKGILTFIEKQGGVSAVAHPHRSDTGILYNVGKGTVSEKEADATLKATDLVEIVNFKSIIRQEEDGTGAAQRHGKPALASTDAHYTVEVGKAFTCFELPEGAVLTPELLRSAPRTLWAHPVKKVPKKAAAVPLLRYEPSVDRVARWKKYFGPLIPLLGKVLYSWQAYGWKRAKENQIAIIVRDAPDPKPYKP